MNAPRMAGKKEVDFMKTFHYLLRRTKDNRGTVIVYVAVAIVVLLGCVALAVDVGYVMVSRNEIQNVADGSALAATRRLGFIYENMTYQAQQSYNCETSGDVPIIKQAALDVASSNVAAQQNINLNAADDIIIGKWNANTKTLSPTYDQPDAVRVIARRPGAPTFFAKIFGSNTFNVSGIATAALTPQGTTGPGGLPIPFGLSKYYFDLHKAAQTDFCGKQLILYPTCASSDQCDTVEEIENIGCGGWHTYLYDPPSASRLDNIVSGLIGGTFSSPPASGQTYFNYTGGTLASLWTGSPSPLEDLFNTMRVKNDGVLDNDNDVTTWTTTVVVYDSGDCTNPNQDLRVAGFATVQITGVLPAPDKQIIGKILCDYVEAGRGGGGQYGTLGSIPNLVQ